MSEITEEQSHRNKSITDLFYRWDYSGEGLISLSHLLQILQASERISNKEQKKWVKQFEIEVNNARRSLRSSGENSGRGSSFSLLSGGTINFAEVSGEPSLDPATFRLLVMNLTNKDSAVEFDAFMTFAHKAVEEATNSSQGSKLKREIFDMFRMLDVNHDGHVDMDEIEVLLKTDTKADKKHVTKWKYYLNNKEFADPSKQADMDSPTKSSTMLTLADFQKFVHTYIDQKEERIPQLVSSVKKAVQERQVQYIIEYKVHDIVNDIMEDLLKEQPCDVLAGITKSVERLRRTDKYPRTLRKR